MVQVKSVEFDMLPDSDLLEVWNAHSIAEREAREQRQRIEQILEARMRQRGAEAIPHERYDCKLDKGSPSVDIATIRH